MLQLLTGTSLPKKTYAATSFWIPKALGNPKPNLHPS